VTASCAFVQCLACPAGNNALMIWQVLLWPKQHRTECIPFRMLITCVSYGRPSSSRATLTFWPFLQDQQQHHCQCNTWSLGTAYTRRQSCIASIQKVSSWCLCASERAELTVWPGSKAGSLPSLQCNGCMSQVLNRRAGRRLLIIYMLRTWTTVGAAFCHIRGHQGSHAPLPTFTSSFGYDPAAILHLSVRP
jgi:hypothetical protein